MPGVSGKDATDDASPLSALIPVHDLSGGASAVSGSGPGFSLSDGWDLSGLPLAELWLRYLAMGGTASPTLVAAYTRGQLHPDAYQHNMIAQAINEHFSDLGEDHPVSYQDIPRLP